MFNEISLIEKVFSNSFCSKKIKKIEYLKTILYDDYKELTDFFIVTQNCCSYVDLIKVHGTFLSLHKDLYDIAMLIDYFERKNYITQKKIFMIFNYDSSIKHMLEKTINTMVQLKNDIPVANALHYKFNEAYKSLDTFTTHGHYLPNLSKNKNEHRISDIVLYVRHINKIVRTVYECAVMQIVRKYPFHLLEQ